MTKNEYLARLKSCLECIDASEREAAVQFYTEYFEDAGEDVAAHNSCQKWRTTHVKAYLCI